MTGKELFEKYTALRDFSGSEDDEYAQLLQTIFYQIGNDFFPLLEKAEAEGKKIDVVNPFKDTSILWDEICPEDVILV